MIKLFRARVLPVLGLILLSATVTVRAQNSTNWSSLDRYIKSTMQEWKVPGASVAIVRDGAVVYIKGFGVRDIRTNQPVTADTLFDIGSCTKAFTSAAIAMLVDEGKMQWDGKVNAYIPFFHLHDPLADENVTLRDLLTHRTGLPGTDLLWYIYPQASREDLIRRLAYIQPNTGFRTKFEYQNLMYVAAGYAVGQVAHSTWEQFTQSRLFAPLGMTESDTSATEAQKAPDHATPHAQNPDGSVKAISWRNIDSVGPAGSINSSARDMAKWITFQLGDGTYQGRRLISAKSMREMHSAQMVISLDGEIPKVFFPDSMQLSYGLGWFVQDYRGHQLIIHAGDIDGFATMVVLIPEIHTGYFAVINMGSLYRQVLSNQIADQLLHLPDAGWSERFKNMRVELQADEKAGKAWQSKRTPGTHPSLDLAAYAGQYQNPAYGDAEIGFQNGKLTLHLHTVDSDLEHFQYDTFIVKFRGQSRLTFDLDADGHASEFTVAGIEFKRAPPAPVQ
ncbi:MAG TPA: serine hydrolase [Steroidobacteraceae bacterium]|jgi:CubicO group peptidase (beta-lactamase class C family)|nr:serine hydrolase [Steroidobacteraceae bacterium]